MENQPKLNSSKEVIAFLAERFPHCFSAEGEARPLKIGIFQDLVDRVAGEMNLSKTQLRSALRLYTSSWRYLYGVPTTPRRKEGAERKPRAQKPVEKAPKTVKAPREEQHTPVSDISALTVGQALKVKAGQNAMDATVLEITKDGVRVQLNSGMSLIVRAEHLVF